MPKQYVNVKIPKELAEEIEKIVKEGRLGYRTRAEFMIEACREKVIKLRQ